MTKLVAFTPDEILQVKLDIAVALGAHFDDLGTAVTRRKILTKCTAALDDLRLKEETR